MRELQLTSAGGLPALMDDLYRTFGFWRTAGAFLLAAWRGRRTVNTLSHLSDRMRRDIGVEESAKASEQAVISLWAMPVGYPALRRN
ncbi:MULTISPECIES: DUF1127 domain-containing protein [unclassified Ensifer]|uniref:DUF1127 domain-containing protein n=1 Tax=unclassified Ensifer TaxID=2633371 RepID=UPI000813D89C|nr:MULTISPECIES: DUF1127 domain-containing protein [unclassified Ensifer]OCP04399.1 hypothetical protein BBX50_25475 [Ensifer sp. LC11]OCP04679.1 hypothetical protein BC374_25495 [Ensifer sp. LC13]OCP13324.1 hypothetical protein BC362_05365 [Ensifer sp. LC14]OCP30503.1 hypothetical protein BC364_25510 [Ensifer sp. LC499]